ncbi:mycofactocin-coupled SDR family oxidoreductase [Nocardioides ultimimeridianus]
MSGGRVALVTGAARGIGAATVARLVADGYRVTAFDSCAGAAAPDGIGYSLATKAQLDELVDRFAGKVCGHVGDVRSTEDLSTAVAATLAAHGRLDAVVAGAGVIAGGQPQWTTAPDQLWAQLEVNTLGVWNTATATIPTLLDQPDPSGCRFVAIASAAGERGLFRLAAYNASKHAVVGIVRGLAADLVGTGVTAVAVSPGSTDTEMLRQTAAIYGTTPSALAEHQGLRRLIEPDEIGQTIAWCCSPAAAALNGSVVNADGGFGA